MGGERPSSWARPVEGRVVSGVALALSRRLGMPLRLVRVGLVLDLILGLAMAVAFSVFDHALLGPDASEGLRRTLIAIGLAGFLSYPALALFLPDEAQPRRWDFASATGAIFLAMMVGQVLGFLLEPYWDSAKSAFLTRGPSGFFTWFGDHGREVGWGARDVVLLGFFVSGGTFLWLQRRGVHAFLRSVHVGTSLVALTTVAVGVGVLVPQIDGFEDPDQRVDMAREYADYLQFREFGYQKLPMEMQDGYEQYQAFRWAEGYFLYHLKHLYGLGMPDAAPTPRMEEGLERFGESYGVEERDNRRKQMTAMLTGQEKIREIGAFISDNEDTFWRFFQVCTALQLNRTYKSNWFTTLLILLGLSMFFSAYKGWRFQKGRFGPAFAGGLVAAGFVVFLKATTALSVPWGPALGIAAGVLALGFALGTGVPRSAVSLQKLGFFVVHNGMLVLLLGGLTSKLFTDRGILQLDLRDGPKDTYWRHFDPSKQARMPFAVRLDHFARKDWLGLEVHFPKQEFTSRPPRYTLWTGRTIELDHVDDGTGGTRPDLRIEVLDLHDRVGVGLPLAKEATQPGEGETPLAVLVVPSDHDHGDDPIPPDHDHQETERRYLLPLTSAQQTFRDEVVRDPAGAFRLAAVHENAPAEHFPVATDRLGLLEATVVGEADGEPQVFPVRLGDEIELPGGYVLTIADATTDFSPDTGGKEGSTHPLPLAEQPFGMAGIWVDVTPAEGPVERRIVLEAIDDVEYGRQETFFHPEVVLRLAWDDWSAPGPPRYVLHWSTDGEPSLVGEDGARLPVTVGEPLPLPGTTEILAAQLLNEAVFEKNLELLDQPERADGWEPDFYARSPRGAKLRITRHPDTPNASVDEELMATTDYAQSNLWFASDEHFVLRFVENTEMLPFEWRSVLSILEKDNSGQWYEVPLGSEREREIRVNDYLYYRGYRFFQTNAAPEVPTYSGIGVVYDPGIPIVLLGMYTVICGAAIAFLVRPVVRGRKGASA